MASFLDTLRSGRVLLMDGAMGTELQRAGIQQGECYELWNLTHPDKVRAIHQSYVDAGAEVLLTNTFQAAPGTLDPFVLGDECPPIQTAALNLARAVAAENRFVLYDVGPFKDECRRFAASCSVGFARRSADGLLVETCSDISDLTRILKERTRSDLKRKNLPVLLSWTYRRSRTGRPRTFKGSSAAACARLARRFEIDAIGVNCGRDMGMDEIVEVIHRYHLETDLPLFARPNAGTPTRVDGRWVYPLSPKMMAERLPELLEAGVSMVGGCCGTTPEHIAAMRPIIREWNSRRGL
jgi:5-methyltetrahydrofolate--homocysteine methyltransferase